jgi:hypothetical protein
MESSRKRARAHRRHDLADSAPINAKRLHEKRIR